MKKDAALGTGVSTPVMVEEPTVEDTISILRGLKDRYEVYHGVKIMDNALVSAAVLSNRYITDRFLPDKAIDWWMKPAPDQDRDGQYAYGAG